MQTGTDGLTYHTSQTVNDSPDDLNKSMIFKF